MAETLKEKTESLASRVWKAWGRGLTREIVVAALAVIGTLGVIHYQNQLATFEYAVATTGGVVQRPELGGKDFKIVIDGKPVDNISTATVYIFNRTSQDFEDVPVTITATGNGHAPKLISSRVNLPAEAYTDAGATTRPTDINETKIGYVLKAANRDDKAIFQADLAFEGSVAPTIGVSLIKKGLASEQLDVGRLRKVDDHQNGISWFWALAAVFAVVASAVGAGMAFIMFVFDKRIQAAAERAKAAGAQVESISAKIEESKKVLARERALADILIADQKAVIDDIAKRKRDSNIDPLPDETTH